MNKTVYLYGAGTGDEHGIDWYAWLLQEIRTIWWRLPVRSRDGEGREQDSS